MGLTHWFRENLVVISEHRLRIKSDLMKLLSGEGRGIFLMVRLSGNKPSVDPDLWRHMASLDRNELKYFSVFEVTIPRCQ